MRPEFEPIWKRFIAPNLDWLEPAWNRYAGSFLKSIRGKKVSLFDPLGLSTPQVTKGFNEQDGEIQYAFFCWLKEEGKT